MSIRVLVVEDSLTVRRHLIAALTADPEIAVVGEADDGARAIALCEQLRPDVITLDMVLVGLNGVAVTEHVMAYCPTPIVIVSASTNRGDVFKTYDALAAGALDVFEKPTGFEPDGAWQSQLLAIVKMAARIKVITHPRARLGTYRPPAAPPSGPPVRSSRRHCRLIAIGASTGGPAALVQILRALPARFPLPILVVIHISEGFATHFAEWLDGQSPLRVAYARDGEPLRAAVGRVVLAPPGQHLIVRQEQLRLTREAERHSCRPSVDVLFDSIAHELRDNSAAYLLTGMGRDGAEGLLSIARAGGVTVAQDEATSAVFGMPREAIQLGAAQRVLSLEQIAPMMVALAEDAL